MVDCGWFCGSAQELNWCLDELHWNFNSQGHQFPCVGPCHVLYTIPLLDACRNHQNTALRQPWMTDPSEWAGDLSVESDPCLQYFNLFSQWLGKVYGDNNWHRVAVRTLMQGYRQPPPQSVRAYANCLNAKWRQAGWDLHQHEEVHSDIAWAGLRNCPKNQVRPLMITCTRFEPSTNSSIRLRPWKIHMSNTGRHGTSNNSSVNSSRNSLQSGLRKAANDTIGHPTLRPLTPHAGAPPAHREQTHPADQSVGKNG